MRAWFHLAATAILCFSFARAPLLHAHASDPHHRHARGFTHTHWKVPPDRICVEADDHDGDARMIHWLAGDGSVPAKFVVAGPGALEEGSLTVCAARVAELEPRSHDPPRRPIPRLRGPPA